MFSRTVATATNIVASQHRNFIIIIFYRDIWRPGGSSVGHFPLGQFPAFFTWCGTFPSTTTTTRQPTIQSDLSQMKTGTNPHS